MAKYTVQVRDENDTPLGEFTEWLDLSFSKRLNNYGECAVSLHSADSKIDTLTSLRRYSYHIFRDNTRVWAGEQAHRTGDLDDKSENQVVIQGYDWLEQLSARYTSGNQSYSSTDAGDIAWALINTSQGLTEGDLGFTEGSITATKDRDRTYSYKNIMDAIIQLSEVQEGFDFIIDHDKEFNVYDQAGVDRSSQFRFEYGVNIMSVKIEEDFTKPCNQAIALGSGFGSSQITSTQTDTASRGVHNLRQQRVSYVDVSEQTTLNDKATSVVNSRKQPILTLEFQQIPNSQPGFGSIGLGDIIKIKITKDFYRIDNKFRVYGWDVSVDQNNRETIKYYVSIQ